MRSRQATGAARVYTFIISLRFHLVYMQIGRNTLAPPATRAQVEAVRPPVRLTLDTIVLSRYSQSALRVFAKRSPPDEI